MTSVYAQDRGNAMSTEEMKLISNGLEFIMRFITLVSAGICFRCALDTKSRDKFVMLMALGILLAVSGHGIK